MKLREVQQAAVTLFAERGFAATGIRDIGRMVSLNSATLYHYAGSKEELLVGIMTDGLEELARAGQTAVERSADPAAQLGYLVSAHVGVTALNPMTSIVIDHELRALSPASHAAVVKVRDEYELTWSEVFARGKEAGQFVVGDIKITRLAVIEMCNGVAHWYNPEGELSITEIQEHFVDLAGRMVGIDNLARRLDQGFVPPVRFPAEPPAGVREE